MDKEKLLELKKGCEERGTTDSSLHQIVTEELTKLNEAVKHHDKNTVSLCLELFKLRFKSDYKALCEGKEYPINYFNEWCSRIETGNAMGYGDLETQRALTKAGIK